MDEELKIGQVWQYIGSGVRGTVIHRRITDLLPSAMNVKVVVAEKCLADGSDILGAKPDVVPFILTSWCTKYRRVTLPPPKSEKEFCFYVMPTKNLAGEVSTMRILSESSASANDKKKAMYKLTFSHDGDVMKTERL